MLQFTSFQSLGISIVTGVKFGYSRVAMFYVIMVEKSQPVCVPARVWFSGIWFQRGTTRIRAFSTFGGLYRTLHP